MVKEKASREGEEASHEDRDGAAECRLTKFEDGAAFPGDRRVKAR